jgi:hypothetical protein
MEFQFEPNQMKTVLAEIDADRVFHGTPPLFTVISRLLLGLKRRTIPLLSTLNTNRMCKASVQNSTSATFGASRSFYAYSVRLLLLAPAPFQFHDGQGSPEFAETSAN